MTTAKPAAKAARVLIVGMGSIGLRHTRLYSNLPDMTVEVCESRQGGIDELRRQSPTVKCWSDFPAALDSKPDYLVIATPHQLHSGMAVAALERGIPVLCEKPMSHDLAEAGKMAEASRRHKTPLAIGYYLRFHSGIQRLRHLMTSGKVGPLVYARYCADSLAGLANSRSRYQETLPGALFMDYSHGIDLLYHVIGEVPKTIAMRGINRTLGDCKASPMLCSGIFGYENAIQAELHCSYVLKPEVHTLQVIGERLGVLVELTSGMVEIHNIEENTLERIFMPFDRDQIFVRQFLAFRNFCLGQTSELCTGDDGLKTNQQIDRLLSLWTKQEK